MKKFGFKIALSCAALAASAATLATTTFAWYTSNAKVSASNITAGTSDTSASTLQIATALDSTFGSAIDFSEAGNKGSANNNNLDNGSINTLLAPVQYGADGDGAVVAGGPALANGQNSIFYQQASAIAQAQAKTTTTTNTPDSAQVVNFSLFFKNPGATQAVTLHLNKFTITNTTSAGLRTTQVAAPDRAGIPSTFTSNTYTVDLLRALKIAAWSTTYADGQPAAASTDKKQVWGVNAFAAGNDSIGSSVIGTNGWDAHLYLNNARGFVSNASDPANEAIPDTEKITTNYYELRAGNGSGTGAITLGDIPAVVVDDTDENSNDLDVLRVDFFIFVDGWDFACFDAVQGQTFDLDLGFALAGEDGADYSIVA